MLALRKQRKVIHIGETVEFFETDLYVGAEHTTDGNSQCIFVDVGRDGFGTKHQRICRGESHTFFLGNPYEIRVLSVSAASTEINVSELPVIETADSVFQSSSIFESSSIDDEFTEREIEVLRSQLNELQKKVDELYSFSTTEAEYTRAAFKLLNEKLDTSSKAGWRQAAYGVLASIGLSISVDIDQAGNFFRLAESYLSSATNYLLGNG